jgi:hypothetical protein
MPRVDRRGGEDETGDRSGFAVMVPIWASDAVAAHIAYPIALRFGLIELLADAVAGIVIRLESTSSPGATSPVWFVPGDRVCSTTSRGAAICCGASARAVTSRSSCCCSWLGSARTPAKQPRSTGRWTR